MTEKIERHPVLTFFLVIMIIGSGIMFLLLFFGGAVAVSGIGGKRAIPIVLGLASLICMISAIALWHYRKWGFWGIVTGTAVFIVVDLILPEVPLSSVFMLLLVILVLYGLLRLGGEKQAWKRLK